MAKFLTVLEAHSDTDKAKEKEVRVESVAAGNGMVCVDLGKRGVVEYSFSIGPFTGEGATMLFAPFF
jgi:hypothetical protein